MEEPTKDPKNKEIDPNWIIYKMDFPQEPNFPDLTYNIINPNSPEDPFL